MFTIIRSVTEKLRVKAKFILLFANNTEFQFANNTEFEVLP